MVNNVGCGCGKIHERSSNQFLMNMTNKKRLLARHSCVKGTCYNGELSLITSTFQYSFHYWTSTAAAVLIETAELFPPVVRIASGNFQMKAF